MARCSFFSDTFAAPHGLFSWLFLASPHLLPCSLSIPLVLSLLTNRASCSAHLSLTRSAMNSSTLSLRNSWAVRAEVKRNTTVIRVRDVVLATSRCYKSVIRLGLEITGYVLVYVQQKTDREDTVVWKPFS